MGGTSSSIPALELAADEFADIRPDIRVNVVRGLGSGGGIQALISGALDISVATRKPKGNETAHNLSSVPFFTDPIVFVSHSDTGVSMLTEDQLVAIYEGKVENWSELGGAEGPLLLVSRTIDDSETERIVAHFPKLENATWGPNVRIVEDDTEKVRFIADNPGAAGFVNLRFMRLSNVDATLIDVGDLVYSDERLESRTYPLLVDLFLIMRPDLTAPAHAFLDHLTGPAFTETLRARWEYRG